jgi:hypothetical protein
MSSVPEPSLKDRKSDSLRNYAHISAWNPSSVKSVSLDEILTDPAAKPVLQSWFGIDPGPAPIGTVPDDIEEHEMPYIQQP